MSPGVARRAPRGSAVGRALAQVRRRRRLIASACLGLSVALGLNAVRPAPPLTAVVLVASHDLVAGQVLGTGDVTARRFPADLVPDGALTRVDVILARRVTGAVRSGEPLTDTRLVGPAMAHGLAGQVVVPVRLADAEVARLVHPGDRVDVVAMASDPVGQPLTQPPGRAQGQPGDGRTGAADTSRSRPDWLLASAALVLSAPPDDGQPAFGSGSVTAGALVVLAVPESDAARLVAAATPLTLLLHVTSD